MKTCCVILCGFIAIILTSAALGQRKESAPATVSPVVINDDGGDTCPSQSQIHLQLTAAKTEIQDIIESEFPEPCGGIGWKKIIDLNMTDPSEVCPSNLTLITSPVRGCGRRQTESNKCDSVTYSSGVNMYSKVCGRILAYQRGITYGLYLSVSGGLNNIERIYVDGLSLTHGPAGSRKHIWTFVAALSETYSGYVPGWNCECTNNQYSWPFQAKLRFVGNDYFCDTGNPGPSAIGRTYYSDDPLWDGQGCGPHSSCCQLNNPPWFYKELSQATGDNIELRLCLHAYRSHSDVIIQETEIYVK